MSIIKTLKITVILVLGYVFVLPMSVTAHADEASSMENAQVMQAFATHETKKTGVLSIEDQKKRLVMFILGVPLLVLLLITGGLGIAMGVYGRQVFVAHMIFAGLSMTLAIAHAIVGMVWFFPF